MKKKTYQAWNGIDKATYEINPKFNYSGAIYDADGNIVKYYDNETDNYWQKHYHLLWEQNFQKMEFGDYFSFNEWRRLL